MDISLYRKFFEIQQKHWWFVVKKSIILDTIARLRAPKGPVSNLDIGCGAGLMLDALAKRGATCGMDMSDEAIRFSQEIFKGTIRKGSLPDDVPYEAESFSLITALDVIEHVEEDVAALRRLKALLIRDGAAVITVPANMSLWSAHDVINEHKRRYTAKELADKLSEAGFVIERITYFNTLLFPVVYVVRKLNNLLGRDGASDVEMPGSFVNGILTGIFGLEKYLLRHLRLPFGVSILAVVRKQ
jgi:2-polyprenyl-3-methyl-5-hydroxy-6-metoxy-1,4-benzoquinol methylase